MAQFIPGKANPKRRRAAMQAALYNARKDRKERADPNAYAPSPATVGHHWAFVYADNGDVEIADGKPVVALVSN